MSGGGGFDADGYGFSHGGYGAGVGAEAGFRVGDGGFCVGSLCYSFLQAEAPLTLGSYGAVEENAAIGIELTSRALAAGNGTYSLLGLSGEGAADELAVADFTLTAETLERLGSNGEAALQVSEDGQSLQVVLSGLVPEAHYYERLMGSAASMNGLAGLRLADAALVSQRRCSRAGIWMR